MNIIALNRETLDAGRSSFEDYLLGTLCGRGASEDYDRAMSRFGGVDIIPGAIEAMILKGIHDHEAIVFAVSRVSRCRRSTVRAVIVALTESEDGSHLWVLANGNLFLNDAGFGGEPPHFLIAS